MKEKKKLKLVIVIIAVIIILPIFLLLILHKDETELKNNENNMYFSDISFADFSLLTDSVVGFSLQNIINEYFEYKNTNNTQKLNEILNSKYQKDLNNSNNIETVYFTDKIYQYSYKNYEYYFLDGYITEQSLMDDKIAYTDDVNFFVIVNKMDSKVSIYPLENNDFSNFVLKYKFGEEQLNYPYKSINITGKNMLKLYINNYLSLLFNDQDKAYNMLGNNTKKYFGSKEEFIKQIDFIYNSLTTSIFSYSVEKEDDIVIYRILDDNQNDIIIYENGALSYTIDFNING